MYRASIPFGFNGTGARALAVTHRESERILVAFGQWGWRECFTQGFSEAKAGIPEWAEAAKQPEQWTALRQELGEAEDSLSWEVHSMNPRV